MWTQLLSGKQLQSVITLSLIRLVITTALLAFSSTLDVFFETFLSYILFNDIQLSRYAISYVPNPNRRSCWMEVAFFPWILRS